ncbi:MAG: hypothetical protein ABIL16_06305 [candidate division WOR-3 bacterium]
MYYEPITPEYVVKNLETAYKLEDIEKYKECLDKDSFKFYFDPSQSDIKDILRDRWGIDSLSWGYNEEITSAQRIFDYASNIVLNIINGSPIYKSESLEVWIWDYYLKIEPPFEGQGEAIGKAVFTFVKRGDYWYIRLWQDYKSGM